MAAFLDELSLTELTDTENSQWKVNNVFRYRTDIEKIGIISVPSGFVTDLCSVPRIPFIFDALGSDANKPAVIHDACYWSGWYPRTVADDILLEAMGVIGMSWWRRYAIYLGVRLGGWIAWDHHRDAHDETKL